MCAWSPILPWQTLDSEAHLQDADGPAYPVLTEVGDPHRLGEALLHAAGQTLHEGVVAPRLGQEARPVHLIQPYLVHP